MESVQPETDCSHILPYLNFSVFWIHEANMYLGYSHIKWQYIFGRHRHVSSTITSYPGLQLQKFITNSFYSVNKKNICSLFLTSWKFRNATFFDSLFITLENVSVIPYNRQHNDQKVLGSFKCRLVCLWIWFHLCSTITIICTLIFSLPSCNSNILVWFLSTLWERRPY